MTKHKFKTNALRMLDKQNISYEIKEYDYDEEHLSGEHIVNQVDLLPEQIFKTLVLQDSNKEYLVCCIPVLQEINLKLLAKVANVKSVAMIHQKDLLNITGYVRGGCSPIGMKKQYRLFVDESINSINKVAFSAGKRGYQMVLDVNDFINFTNPTICQVI